MCHTSHCEGNTTILQFCAEAVSISLPTQTDMYSKVKKTGCEMEFIYCVTLPVSYCN